MWCEEDGADERLVKKLKGDLLDMADLKAAILDADADAVGDARGGVSDEARA
jgi:hypothetical protein